MRQTAGWGWIGQGAALVVLVLALMLTALPLRAQSLGGLARVAGALQMESSWRSLGVTLPLTQPVPWRTRLMADPPRAVIDFRTVDWSGFDTSAVALAGAAAAVRVGDAGGGWSRMIIELTRPMGFAEAGLSASPDGGAAQLRLRLVPLSEAEFARQAALLAVTESAPADPLSADGLRAPLGQRPTVVVLDPGHGGIDPGAVHQGVTEAGLILAFTLDLAEALRRTGRFEVVLTRDSDRFVPLEARITVAHSALGDVFVSLHADALTDGEAQGATLYTLSAEATDAASAALAERHDRTDLLAGNVDLTEADDTVANVLMAMARAETQPATDSLARALIAAIQGAGLRTHRHPWQQAAFSVLKSPSVPSVLLEIGFLSSARDRERMRDPAWRARMVQALVQGLDAWVEGEVAQQDLRRR